MENIEKLLIKMTHFYMHHFFQARCICNFFLSFLFFSFFLNLNNNILEIFTKVCTETVSLVLLYIEGH